MQRYATLCNVMQRNIYETFWEKRFPKRSMQNKKVPTFKRLINVFSNVI